MTPNDGTNQLDTSDRVALDYAFHLRADLIFEARTKKLCISTSFNENMVERI